MTTQTLIANNRYGVSLPRKDIAVCSRVRLKQRLICGNILLFKRHGLPAVCSGVYGKRRTMAFIILLRLRNDMVLYVDETENDDFFIVAGLLVESEEAVNESYKRFKKALRGC